MNPIGKAFVLFVCLCVDLYSFCSVNAVDQSKEQLSKCSSLYTMSLSLLSLDIS